MFKQFLYPMVEEYTFLNIFQYISLRSAYAAVTALLISFLFGPRIIKLLTRLKFGQSIREDGPDSHKHKTGTPTMGGVLIVVAVFVSVLLWQDFSNPYVWIVLLAAFGFALIGFIDDLLKIKKKNSDGLAAWIKFAGQSVVALVVMLLIYYFRHDYTTLFYFPFYKDPLFDMGIWFIPAGVFLIVGFSNAVNLTDGLDGLATGLMIFALIAIAVISYLTGHIKFAEYLNIPYISEASELTVVILALLGACVGFLWFNSHPAQIFMGDCGSLMMGGLLAVFSLILKKEVLLLVIGGVFVIETLSVILQVGSYKLRKKRIFKMAPLHHHYELKGLSETKVVTRFWIMGGMLAIVALSLLKVQ